VRFCLDIFLEDLNFCNLRVAVVHHLVQQLICDDKVVSERLVLKLTKVGLKDFLHSVEERQDHYYVWVSAGYRYHVDVVYADPDESRVAFSEHRL